MAVVPFASLAAPISFSFSSRRQETGRQCTDIDNLSQGQRASSWRLVCEHGTLKYLRELQASSGLAKVVQRSSFFHSTPSPTVVWQSGGSARGDEIGTSFKRFHTFSRSQARIKSASALSVLWGRLSASVTPDLRPQRETVESSTNPERPSPLHDPGTWFCVNG